MKRDIVIISTMFYSVLMRIEVDVDYQNLIILVIANGGYVANVGTPRYLFSHES